MYKISFVAILAMLLFSCDRQTDQQKSVDNQHIHTEEAIFHTLFTEDLEFFIEHPLLESGKHTHILVHLTRLDSYTPCTSGEVSFSIGGANAIAKEPIAPGVWELHIEPEGEGHFHGHFSFRGEGIDQSVEAHLDVLHEHDSQHDDHAEHEDLEHNSHQDSETGEITFTKDQAWKGGFFVEEVNSGPFHTVIHTSGELVPLPGEKNNIAATTRGMVHFRDPHLVQGIHVDMGQEMFIISSEALVEDKVSLRREAARNRLDLSRSKFLRHNKLIVSGAISEKLYNESRSVYVEDSLNYYNLEDHISKEGIHISAPSSGSIHELLVSDGIYVSEGELLAILSPDRNLLLRVDLPQQYYDLRESVSGANFRTAYSELVFSQDELQGKLLSVGHSVKENDHYLPVNFLLKNKGNLLEGAFVEVFLMAGNKDEALTIPVAALEEDQGTHFVYVQVNGESYSRRRVVTGQSDGLRTEVLNGLMEGERVVSQGAMLLKAASIKTDAPGHGHSH